MLLTGSRKKPAIGLTPLIDVVFILLIFFMLVMQFQQFQQNPVNLKKSATHAVNSDTVSKVTVQEDDQCLWQGQLLKCQALIEQFSLSDNAVLLGYSNEITLQQLMQWHDKFILSGIATSLAVKANSLAVPGHGDQGEEQ